MAADGAEDPVGTVSLLEAIENTVETKELIEGVRFRIQSLHHQIAKSRSPAMKEQLEAEMAELRLTLSLAETRFNAMAEFIIQMKIFIGSMKLTGEEAMTRLGVLKGQSEELRKLAEKLSLHDFGLDVLKTQRERFRVAIRECHATWTREALALILILEGIQIPDDHREMFQTMWTRVNKPLKIQMVWNASEGAWELPPTCSVTDPELKEYLRKASESSKGYARQGDQAILTATFDGTASTFNVKMKGQGFTFTSNNTL